MARIKKNIIGQLQGKLSDVVFRVRNGKVVVYSRPAKQKVSKSEAAIKARNKFALTVALAKEINSNETLSELWKNSKVNATNSYQKIIKYNSTLTNSDTLTIQNSITPPDGIPLDKIKLNFHSNILSITLETTKFSKQLMKSEKLFCLVYFGKELSKKSKIKSSFILKLFEINLPTLNASKDELVKIDLSDMYDNKFDKMLVFVALTYKSNNKIFFSSTYSRQLI